MSESFFEKTFLNSPYEYPARHWELDETCQPTNHILEQRRSAKYVTPIPRAKKRKREQRDIVFRDREGISTEDQQYDPTPIINEVREHVGRWRALSPSPWNVTPETARLLEHWRHHDSKKVRVA